MDRLGVGAVSYTHLDVYKRPGGDLFIDEAYSLYRGQQDSFGLEAIDTLVKGMDHSHFDYIIFQRSRQ